MIILWVESSCELCRQIRDVPEGQLYARFNNIAASFSENMYCLPVKNNVFSFSDLNMLSSQIFKRIDLTNTFFDNVYRFRINCI